MPRTTLRFAIVLAVAQAFLNTARAGDDASQPAYAGGWTTGSNGGSQLLPWTLAATGAAANSGFFIGDSNNNAAGAGPGINSGPNVAWGMYANSSNVTAAIRPFVTPLNVGDNFGLQMDNGFIDFGMSVGYSLADNLNTVRFSFRATGGSSTYSITDASGTFSTTLNIVGTGLTTSFDVLSPTTYHFMVTDIASATTYQHTGSLVTGTAIDRFLAFNVNAGSSPANDVYFNRMGITPVPEPASVLVICGIAGAAVHTIRRRRRAK